MLSNKKRWNALFAIGLGGLLAVSTGCLIGCSVEDESNTQNNGSGGSGNLSGEIAVDGSSTVYPVSFAMAEEFMKLHPDVQITVSQSGTGGGFEKFARGDIAISDASRPIKEGEKEACAANGIEFVELHVAIDGLTVMVNPENTWCDTLTIDQLKKLWSKGSTVTKWSELDPSWPDEEIKLFGPDTDSGTYDYFVEEICGDAGSRADYEASVDDNVLVTGIAGTKNALGYFGYAYYVENKDKLKAVAIVPEGETEGVLPSDETVESGKYRPLSRPLFIYVSVKELEKPQVSAFVDFYLEQGQQYVREVGYVTLKDATVEDMKARLEAATGGENAESETKSESE